MGYTLCPDYAALFRGDNGQNMQARGEFLWTIDYNDDNTDSDGGTTYLLKAALAQTDITYESRPNGQRHGWSGLRVPYEYVERYFDVSGQNYVTGKYEVADRRGEVFYIKGRQQSMENELYTYMCGWSCMKYNNIPHDQTNESFLSMSVGKDYSDVDFPMIRSPRLLVVAKT